MDLILFWACSTHNICLKYPISAVDPYRMEQPPSSCSQLSLIYFLEKTVIGGLDYRPDTSAKSLWTGLDNCSLLICRPPTSPQCGMNEKQFHCWENGVWVIETRLRPRLRKEQKLSLFFISQCLGGISCIFPQITNSWSISAAAAHHQISLCHSEITASACQSTSRLFEN